MKLMITFFISMLVFVFASTGIAATTFDFEVTKEWWWSEAYDTLCDERLDRIVYSFL